MGLNHCPNGDSQLQRGICILLVDGGAVGTIPTGRGLASFLIRFTLVRSVMMIYYANGLHDLLVNEQL